MIIALLFTYLVPGAALAMLIIGIILLSESRKKTEGWILICTGVIIGLWYVTTVIGNYKEDQQSDDFGSLEGQVDELQDQVVDERDTIERSLSNTYWRIQYNSYQQLFIHFKKEETVDMLWEDTIISLKWQYPNTKPLTHVIILNESRTGMFKKKYEFDSVKDSSARLVSSIGNKVRNATKIDSIEYFEKVEVIK